MIDLRDACDEDAPVRVPIGATHCDCGYPLLPIGTAIRHPLYGIGRVAAWARQCHHTVPVTFGPTDHVIVARDDCSVVA